MKKINLWCLQKQEQFPFNQNTESKYFISCDEPKQAALWNQDQLEVVNSKIQAKSLSLLRFNQ